MSALNSWNPNSQIGNPLGKTCFPVGAPARTVRPRLRGEGVRLMETISLLSSIYTLYPTQIHTPFTYVDARFAIALKVSMCSFPSNRILTCNTFSLKESASDHSPS